MIQSIQKNISMLKNLLHPAAIVCLLLTISVPLTIYLLPKDILRVLDLNLPIPLFFVQTVASVLLFVWLFKDFVRFFKNLFPNTSETKIAVGFVFLFSILTTIFAGTQIEARHRVQSDESVFLSLAQSMHANHISGTCNQGEFQNGNLDCFVHSNSFKTKGLSYLYFLGMPLLGTDLHWAFTAQLIVLPVAVLLFFLALLAWTRAPSFALLGTVLLAMQPTLLFQFRSLSVEPLYVLLFAISLLIFRFAYEQNTWKHWALAALTLAFFAQTRQETFFCFAAFLFIAIPKLLDKKSIKAPVFFLTLAVFCLPVLITVSYYQNFNFQGGAFDAHGHFLEDLIKNWKVMTNVPLLGNFPRNPFFPYFNYLFAFGALVLTIQTIFECVKKRPARATAFFVFSLLYHVQTYVILENVSGDFSIEINQRYSLVIFPMLAAWAAYPFWLLFRYFEEKSKIKDLSIILILCVSAVCIWQTYSFKPAFNANIMYNRNHLTTEEVEIWKWLKNAPGEVNEKLFVYARPYHFIGYGLSALHYDRVRSMSEADLKNWIDKYNGEVFYIRGLDCWDSRTYHAKAVEHRIPTTCDRLEQELELESITNILITNNYYVQIARVLGKRNYEKQNVLLKESETQNENGEQKIKFRMNESGTHPWRVTVLKNGQSESSFPYQLGSFETVLPKTSNDSGKLSGYTKIQVIVSDTSDHRNPQKIAEFSEYYLPTALPTDFSSQAAPKNSFQKLGDMNLSSHTQGFGTFQKNKSNEGNVFKIQGEAFPEGIGIHAPSKTEYILDSKFSRLQAIVGLDDESLCSDGAILQIFGDGKLLAESELHYKQTTIDVNLQGVSKLWIQTLPKESKDCDHVDIVLPLLFSNL